MSAVRRMIARRHPTVAATALAACAITGACAAPGLARSNATATNTVSATISYTDGSKSTVPVWKNIKVTIKLEERTLVNAELLPPAARESVFSAPKLLATDLDDDGEAEVLVDVFTAGVDCCRRTVVYHRSGDAYDTQLLDWADTGYRLDDVIGQSSPEFLASDARFPKAWDSDARGPLRVFQMRGGRVKDVSRRARRQLLRDARIHLKAWRSVRRKGEGDARPIIAAYVADLVRIREVAAAKEALRNADRADELRTSRAAFARSLDRKLRAWGYTSRRVLSR